MLAPCLTLTFTLQDIFRRYPQTYEGVIPTLCANLEELDEPEAKASLIWIMGEYENKIDNADELLGVFVDTFTEESYAVQLQTLTARHIIVDFSYIHHGKKEENPLNYVKFYSKRKPNRQSFALLPSEDYQN